MSALAPVTSSNLPFSAQDSVLLAGSNPLLALRGSAAHGGTQGAMPGASAGNAQIGAAAVGTPPITARIAAAVRAAVGELRGAPSSTMQLPMTPAGPEAAPVAGPQPAHPGVKAVAKHPAKPGAHAGAKGTAHAAAKPGGHAAAAQPTGSAGLPEPGVGGAPSQAGPTMIGAPAQGVPVQGALAGSVQLPPNAMQLPGATVYSYDGNGNPALAGLQGLPMQTQQQLGMLPGLGSMADQWGARAEQNVPQINATNQTSIPGGVGPGMLAGPLAPGALAPVTSTGDTQRGSAGAQQRVVNTNSNEQVRREQGMGYGAGWGSGVLPYGLGSSYQSWGPSMSGPQPGTGTGVSGFFSRMFS